jgi:hypothetical protein
LFVNAFDGRFTNYAHETLRAAKREGVRIDYLSTFRNLPDALEAKEGGTGRRPTLSPLRISQLLSG